MYFYRQTLVGGVVRAEQYEHNQYSINHKTIFTVGLLCLVFPTAYLFIYIATDMLLPYKYQYLICDKYCVH